MRNLENILADIQVSIDKCGVTNTLSRLVDDAPFQSFDCSPNRLESVLGYAIHFKSFDRIVSILCLKYRESFLASTPPLDLVSACLQACRYSDVLQLVQRAVPITQPLARLAVQACYRLGRWDELQVYASNLDPDCLPSQLRLILARTHLERGFPLHALASLSNYVACDEQDDRQHRIVLLLARHKAGLLNISDISTFLSLVPYSTDSELAALARLWPSVEGLMTPDELSSEDTLLAARYFWQRLSNPIATLIDSGRIIPPISSSPLLKSCAFAVDSLAVLPLCSRILSLIQQRHPEVSQVYILLLCDIETISHSEVPCIHLHGLSLSAALWQVRSLRLDILIDCVGIDDARWLQILTQKVARQQIGWRYPVLSSYPLLTYDYILSDRWLQSPSTNIGDSRAIVLSGLVSIAETMPFDVALTMSPSATNHQIDIVVLGAPSQLLPGTSSLMALLIAARPDITFVFVDSAWSEPGLLETWWSQWQRQALPDSFRMIDNISSLIAQRGAKLIGISVNLTPLYEPATLLLGMGIPIVCFKAALASTTPMLAIMESLGLSDFITSDPERFVAIVETLIDDDQLFFELRQALPAQLKSSLVADHNLFASDLAQALLLLEHTL